MKLKSWVVWLLVAAFLASVVLLFSANSQKNAVLVSLNESKQQAADLQSQLEQATNSIADSQSAELSKLRADNQDLPRLRNEVTMLTAANAKLTEQLKAILSAAQDQQAQLQRLATENQQARAAVQQAGAAIQQADAEAARNSCINNLRQIDAAKNEWALENNKTADAVPTAQELLPYLKDGIFPACPSGGTYTIGVVGVNPTCSIPGHAIPQTQ